MFVYEKKLQYPIKITTPNPKLAAIIITQYGGPDSDQRRRASLEPPCPCDGGLDRPVPLLVVFRGCFPAVRGFPFPAHRPSAPYIYCKGKLFERAWGVAMVRANQHGQVTVRCTPFWAAGDYTFMVYDASNHIVSFGKTARNGTASFQVDSCGEYRVRVCSKRHLNPRAVNRWLLLRPERAYALHFVFRSFFLKQGFVTAMFRLTDRNYDGLPIQKGEIQLCQAPMKF